MREKFLEWHTELKENIYVFDFQQEILNFLQENTIAIIPPHGYHSKDKQSLLALKWFSYKAEKEDIYIRHARNAGEKRVAGYLLDGYHEETNKYFEINGCFWHGEFSFLKLTC